MLAISVSEEQLPHNQNSPRIRTPFCRASDGRGLRGIDAWSQERYRGDWNSIPRTTDRSRAATLDTASPSRGFRKTQTKSRRIIDNPTLILRPDEWACGKTNIIWGIFRGACKARAGSGHDVLLAADGHTSTPRACCSLHASRTEATALLEPSPVNHSSP